MDSINKFIKFLIKFNNYLSFNSVIFIYNHDSFVMDLSKQVRSLVYDNNIFRYLK